MADHTKMHKMLMKTAQKINTAYSLLFKQKRKKKNKSSRHLHRRHSFCERFHFKCYKVGMKTSGLLSPNTLSLRLQSGLWDVMPSSNMRLALGRTACQTLCFCCLCGKQSSAKRLTSTRTDGVESTPGRGGTQGGYLGGWGVRGEEWWWWGHATH